MSHITTKTVRELVDGDLFSLDGGRSWLVCAVTLFGNVAVYLDSRRGDLAPTVRVEAGPERVVLVQGELHRGDLAEGDTVLDSSDDELSDRATWVVKDWGIAAVKGGAVDWDWASIEDNGGFGTLYKVLS